MFKRKEQNITTTAPINLTTINEPTSVITEQIKTIRTKDAKCKLDNYYIEHFSVWFDIKMLLGTVHDESAVRSTI